ncbi:MAG: DUF1549 domain-containing protein [Acidobacteria bacterium]|nr:DUF1549 domain-containing protein [Acidobacteriota bacterium]
MSPMPAEVHAPLFNAPAVNRAGQLTERVTAGLPQASAPQGRMPRANFIDEHIFSRIERENIPHAPLADDREFLRRVRLDLTGRIPSPAETREFLADTAPNKRAKLIDRLLDSPEYSDKWSYFFLDMIRANGKMGRGVDLFHMMVKDSLAANRPYDDMVRSIIAASPKSSYTVSAAGPIVREHVEGKPGEEIDNRQLNKVHQMDTHDELAILYGKLFLGINLACISCHDGKRHLEKVNVYLTGKKRTEFFHMAAFMGRTRYVPQIEKREAVMGHFMVDDYGPGYNTKADSMLRIKRFGGPSDPAFVLTGETPKAGEMPRDALARMLTSHPQFTRATANLYWARLMGVGIVEPFDEFDLARQDPKTLPAGWDLQPSHPELLNALGAWFQKNNYSIAGLLRVICNSNAYQLSARFPGEWRESYAEFYARKFARMLTAEDVHDAIASATDRPGNFKMGRRGTGETVGMAMQLSMPRASGELKSFMQAFGQSNRGTPPRAPSPSPLQPIMMMCSEVVNDRVLAAKDSRLERFLGAYQDDAKVVDELFMASIARMPSAAERALAMSAMKANRVEGAQNVQWALLNLVEFLYNF